MLWRCYACWYDRLWDHRVTELVGRTVASHLDPRLAVVEVGAGTGLVTTHLVRGSFGVDASEPRAAMARRFERRIGHPPTPIALEGLEPDGEAHNVVAAGVVHLTPDPARTIGHLRLLAGSDGRVVWTAPRPGLTLRAMDRALRRAGWPGRRRFEFLVAHLALAPLTRLARAGLDQRVPIPTDSSTRVARVLGVVDVFVTPHPSP